MEGKRTKGRQKIMMKIIEDKEDRLITFSKRRSGIYKKANELITLCGAKIAVLVFSPAGKPFCFGHDSFESVTSRFLGQNYPISNTIHPLIEAHRKARIDELNQQYNLLQSELALAKEHAKMLRDTNKGKEKMQAWWDSPIEEYFNVQELQKKTATLENLYVTLCKKINEKTNV